MNSINKIDYIENCALCFEDFEKDGKNDCLLTRCGHIFHESCVTEWIERNESCPICKKRAVLPINSIKGMIYSAMMGGLYTSLWLNMGIAILYTALRVGVFYMQLVNPNLRIRDDVDFNWKEDLRLAIKLNVMGIIFGTAVCLFLEKDNVSKDSLRARRISYIPSHPSAAVSYLS